MQVYLSLDKQTTLTVSCAVTALKAKGSEIKSSFLLVVLCTDNLKFISGLKWSENMCGVVDNLISFLRTSSV